MLNPRQLILDTWSGLSHNSAMGDGTLPPTQCLAPTWVGSSHTRRLQAYTILASYLKNVARWHLHFSDEEDRRTHREYGDPDLIVQTIRAAILGGLPRPLVDRAEGVIPDYPTEADVTDGGPTLPELVARWNEEHNQITAARERQSWLDAQFKVERAAHKIIACENNTVGLGDGIYMLSWSNAKRRVRVRTYDPGFYFPVLNDYEDEDYPNRVHLAWEFTDDNDRTFIRRITFDRHLNPAGPKVYPYDPLPSLWTVTMTDATWSYDDLGDKHVDDLDMSKATINVNADGIPLRDYDLGIDFLPVIHVPNTVPESDGNPWGQSALIRVAQLLDDLARNDTDQAATADLLGSPPLAIDDSSSPIGGLAAGEIMSYGPGQVWSGKVSMVDTSKSLDALLKRAEALYERLSVNRQLPQSILGRVQPSEVPSGLALLLSFGPFRQLIDDHRLIRVDKYRTLCKFWQRLAIVGGSYEGNADAPGALPAGSQVLDAGLAFGSYVPADVQAVKDLVVDLVQNHIISTGTGLRLLQEAGLNLTDVKTEAQAAERENVDAALKLSEAVNSFQAAADRLGLDIPMNHEGRLQNGLEGPIAPKGAGALTQIQQPPAQSPPPSPQTPQG